MKIMLENKFGVKKVVKVGFSWTVFFWGFFVPLFRGDFKYMAFMIAAAVIGNFVFPIVGGWAAMIIFMFKYNEWYLDDLKNKGYKEV